MRRELLHIHTPSIRDCATSLKSPDTYAWSRAASSRLVAGFMMGVPLEGDALAVGLVVAEVDGIDDWWAAEAPITICAMSTTKNFCALP